MVKKISVFDYKKYFGDKSGGDTDWTMNRGDLPMEFEDLAVPVEEMENFTARDDDEVARTLPQEYNNIPFWVHRGVVRRHVEAAHLYGQTFVYIQRDPDFNFVDAVMYFRTGPAPQNTRVLRLKDLGRRRLDEEELCGLKVCQDRMYDDNRKTPNRWRQIEFRPGVDSVGLYYDRQLKEERATWEENKREELRAKLSEMGYTDEDIDLLRK